MAVFMNIARMLGAGPLMVMLTRWCVGLHRSKPPYSTFMSSSVAIDTPRVADLAVDVRARVGVVAVERDRVKGGGQALGCHAVELSSLKRVLVRNGSPSPANMRVGSSPSRLKAKVPAV